MCGIAGAFRYDGGVVDTSLLKLMSERMAHRGPDGQGFLSWNIRGIPIVSRDVEKLSPSALGLVHRRLAIIDISERGFQPMQSRDGRYSIVFNGEIYNHVELRKQFESDGAVFRGTSDTEVLLEAYSRWGERCLEHLVGMFAFAILDSYERKLFLARDWFGIKPLYWFAHRGVFAFASEPDVLRTLKEAPCALNPEVVYNYLCYGDTDCGEQTFIQGIYSLPPAHHMTISLDDFREVKPVRYWSLTTSITSDISLDEAAGRVRELFFSNINMHLRSDVPVGVALSGGIDSSANVCCMRRISPDLDLRTFSYVSDNPLENEEKWMDIVGTSCGASMFKVNPKGDELAQNLEELIKAQGEPFGGTSIFAQYRVMQLARENGVKVMLDGQGADEILGGYTQYYGVKLASLMKAGRLIAGLRFVHTLLSSEQTAIKPLLRSLGYHSIPNCLLGTVRRLVGSDTAPSWVDEEWFRDAGYEPTPPPDLQSDKSLRGVLRKAVEGNLVQLLRYEDRNSMAHSIESRVPFLTKEFVEFLFTLPEDFIISPQAETKHVFRLAMQGVVPDAVLERRDKIGFATPERQWLAASGLVDSMSEKTGVGIHMKNFKNTWDAVLRGQQGFQRGLWWCVNLSRWAESSKVSLP